MLRAPIALTCFAVTSFAAPAQDAAPTAPDADPVLIGSGAHTYEWVAGWGLQPDGSAVGKTHGCMAVDRAGNIYCNTDTDRAVMVFDRDGALVRQWGSDFRGGLHGMTLVRETVGDKEVEFLYLAHLGRHEVVKTTLEGEVLWTLGCPMESGLYDNANQYRPTAVAVAPDGTLFVADGYGKSWVHVFDKDREYLRSFGGAGTEREQMRTPHGLCLDTRGDQPQLIVCDRENHRLKWYSLDGELLRVVDEGLRRPCNVAIHGRDLVVADLAGRVTVLDHEGAVVCHLGEQPEPSRRATDRVEPQHWRAGEFLSPHGVAVDAHGDIYVLDWSQTGRFTRLRHRPAAPGDPGKAP